MFDIRLKSVFLFGQVNQFSIKLIDLSVDLINKLFLLIVKFHDSDLPHLIFKRRFISLLILSFYNFNMLFGFFNDFWFFEFFQICSFESLCFEFFFSFLDFCIWIFLLWTESWFLFNFSWLVGHFSRLLCVIYYLIILYVVDILWIF